MRYEIPVGYGNPEVNSITNFNPLFPVTVLARTAEYPDYDALKKAITELSESAWFLDATGMALKLGSPIVANVIVLGALLGLNLLPITRDDIEAELKSNFPQDRVALNLKALDAGSGAVAGS